jgi:hypothetical protein
MSPDKTNISSIPTLPSRADVISAARDWIGVRWLHQGRNRAGIDCAGLLIQIHLELNLPVEDKTGYKRTPNALDFLNHIRRQTTFCATPMPGSIAVFRQEVMPCHTGIFAEKNGILTIIHADATQGKVLEEPFIHDWPRLLVEARNIIGLSD